MPIAGREAKLHEDRCIGRGTVHGAGSLTGDGNLRVQGSAAERPQGHPGGLVPGVGRGPSGYGNVV